MIKYIFVGVFLLQVSCISSMDHESKASRLKALREMGAGNKATTIIRSMPPEESADEDRRLILECMEYKLKKRDESHQRSLAFIQQKGEEQIARLARVVEKQTDTIMHLNSLLQALLKKFYRTDTHVRSHDQEITELKQVTDSHFENLVEAVGDQTELITRQNKAIRELLSRVDKQTNKLKMQGALINKIQKVVRGISNTLTNRELEELLLLFQYEQPEVTSDDSDPEIYQQVLGRPTLKVSSEELIKDQSTCSQEVEEEGVLIREELQEGVREIRTSDGQMVEETIIIEDIAEESRDGESNQ